MTQKPTERFGTYIKELRCSRQVSLRAVAARSGLDSGALTRLEAGKVRQPKLETLKSLAEALDAPYSDLCAMAGYLLPYDLPSLTPYLRTRYGHLPEHVLHAADDYLQHLIDEQQLDLRGPMPGEDEYSTREQP